MYSGERKVKCVESLNASDALYIQFYKFPFLSTFVGI